MCCDEHNCFTCKPMMKDLAHSDYEKDGVLLKKDADQAQDYRSCCFNLDMLSMSRSS